MTTSSLDYWRGFFRAAGDSDIFHVIRQAIHVAASDHPDEFKSRRDEIAQMLFAALHPVEKADEGRENSVAIEDKKDDGRDNAAVKVTEVKAIEEREEDSGRGNAVKSVGTLLPPLTPSEEQKPELAAVAVDDEENADTMSRETWKVSVSENGKIRLRRLIHDQTKSSEPQKTSTEHPPVIAPEPSNQEQEGSLPTFIEHRPAEPPVIASSTRHPQGRLQRTSTEHKPESVIAVAQPEPPRLLPNMSLDDASLRSKLEMSKRKLREGYQQTENAKRQRRIQVIQPRAEIPKDSNTKPPLFKSLGTWLR